MWVELDRAIEMCISLQVGLGTFQVMAVLATQQTIVGVKRAAGFPACSFQSSGLYPCRQHSDDALRDIVLHCKNIFQAAVVALRPHMVATLPID